MLLLQNPCCISLKHYRMRFYEKKDKSIPQQSGDSELNNPFANGNFPNPHIEQPVMLAKKRTASPWMKIAAVFLEVSCGISIFVFGSFTFQEIGLGDFPLTENNLIGEFLESTLPEIHAFDLLAFTCAFSFTFIFIVGWRRALGDQPSVRSKLAERLITAFFIVAVLIVAASEATFAIAMVEQRASNPLNPAELENPGIAYFSAVLFIFINATAGLTSALSFTQQTGENFS